MIRHVVMWKLNGASASEKQEQAERVRAALRGLLGKVPGMSSLEVGIGHSLENEQLSDLVLITTHESWKALDTYQRHPDHHDVAQLISEMRSERRVVDFEIDEPEIEPFTKS